ncbi:MAG: histidine ammonia-lyase [Eubacteriales bacterium]|nr:histidine ammonia-lyase [Eubacteriales bacterium]MDD4583318.1 histidine ammonia-lyase [Eubacteriales bacterium]
MKTVVIGGAKCTIEELLSVVRNGCHIELSKEAKERIQQSRRVVEDCVEEEKVVYGLTTGFGKFSDVNISEEDSFILQENLIKSHSCGVGDPLPNEVVKAMMLLRINALSVGYSGIRLSTVQTLVDMVNKDVIPIVPCKGSLGASGDLVPLAHMSLVLLGMGEAMYQGEKIAGEEAMRRAGIAPVKLTAKEGLALINGTQAMCSLGALTVADSETILKTADIIGAFSMEAENGIIDAMDPRIHKVRGQPGQIATADNIRRLLQGSKNITHQGDLRVQDAYVFRCIPQIHGASRDTIEYVRGVVSREMNGVTDNPIVFADTHEAISGGNFHGQYLALSLDFLGIALAELANVSERRIERLVNPALSGLPAFLVRNGGLNSGMMIPHYTAASLVSENKVLAHPASVDSIPTSANQEDHVSMGMLAARKAREVLINTVNVLGIELMCGAQALEFQGISGLSPAMVKVYRTVRKAVPPLDKDRILYKDMETCTALILEGVILRAVEEAIGKLK